MRGPLRTQSNLSLPARSGLNFYTLSSAGGQPSRAGRQPKRVDMTEIGIIR